MPSSPARQSNLPRTGRSAEKGSSLQAPTPHELVWRELGIVVGLLVLALVIGYFHTLSAPFVFDDVTTIVNPSSLQTLAPLRSILTGSRGLTLWTFSLNRALHGLDTRGYHLTNLAIHLAAALTLFGLVRRTLLSDRLRDRFGTGATGIAFAAALIWMVHPLQTQSVTYTVQRLESLMGLFYLLTLYCFCRAVGPRANVWLTASVFCCAAGLRSKEVMITAPLVVVWYDRAFVSSSWRDLLRQHKYYYLALFGVCTVLMGSTVAPVLQGLTSQLASADPSAPIANKSPESTVLHVPGITPWTYLLTQADVILHYLRLCLWPTGLCLDYGWPITQSWRQAAPAGLVVLGLLSATVWAIFRKPGWAFLGGVFFIVLAPTSSFIPIQDAAVEHRMYVPLAAVVVAVVIVAYLAIERFCPRKQAAERLAVAGLAVVAFGLTTATYLRNIDYGSDLAVWQDVVNKRPNNARAVANLGLALSERGQTEAAIACTERALALNPSLPYAHLNMGNIYRSRGELDRAIAAYEAALQWQPKYPKALLNLSATLCDAGRYDDALRRCEQLLALDPKNAGGYSNRGLVLSRLGRRPAAIDDFQSALKLDPQYRDAHINLANELARERRFDEAIRHYHQALEIDPQSNLAQRNLARALQEQQATP